ncbi:carboxypeptidase O-like isoform X2 [Pseudophryne corroboree]|uniref:carboxypeptidase O-like isoform X2 n=1 Tax=Pseudophryne corroboree TaxID=495146 RepID=UPI003081ED5B
MYGERALTVRGVLRDQVLSIVPETLQQAKHIKEICNELQLDLWEPSDVEDVTPGREVHVQVPSSHLPKLKQNFLQKDILVKVMINDVQKLIDENPVDDGRSRQKSLSSFDYTKYHSMDEIYKWMDQIKDTHKDLVTLQYLGATYETRPIYYLKIGLPSDRKKKIFWMDCGIHAREWISVAFCQWFIKEERLWRKSRSPHNNGTCYGVDLNRNFDGHWCTIGASTVCSSNTYCGPGPASEPEVQAVSQLLSGLKSDILCFLTMHSYSQLILFPYGYTTNASANHEEMMAVGLNSATEITKLYGTQYDVGSSSTILYSTSGSSQDFAADLGIDLAYTFELRDNGTYGFILPEEQIRPTCEETTAGILSIVDYINEKHFPNAANMLSSTLCFYLSFSIIIGTYY